MIALCGVCQVRVYCQSPMWKDQPVLSSSSALPAFEVAVIRKVPAAAIRESTWSLPGVGRFEAKNLSLQFLIQMAFNTSEKQIDNMPKWAKDETFDVVAKPEDGVRLSREELRPRLQNLLKQRFHLSSHFVVREMSGYALMQAKSGGKMEPGKGDTPVNFRKNVYPGRMQGLKWSMEFLAEMLSLTLQETVVDCTGRKGLYNIDLEYAADIAADSTLPSLVTALKDSLGIALEKRNVPVEVLVIDSLDRTPTEN